MLSLLDLDELVIGGQVGRELFDFVQPHIETSLGDGSYLASSGTTLVRSTSLGSDAGAYGGALWAFDAAGLSFLAKRLR
jgi:predicted NBD/HSP70 family sugar kinase